MSNLTDLLPAGAGGKQVDFVASGTLSSGQVVILKSNGTVEAVGTTAVPDSAGTPVIFENAAVLYTAVTYDVTAQKIVIAYSDTGNSSYGTAVVGTVSGTSISFGTPVVFDATSVSWIWATYDVNTGKVVVSYQTAASNYGLSIIGTVSGTSISFGTSVVFRSATTTRIASVYDVNAQKVVIAYTDGGSIDSWGTAIVGTVSGTSISFGSSTVFNYGPSYNSASAYDTTNQKVIIAYMNSNNSNYGTAIVGTVSGTSISFGSATIFNSATTQEIACSYDINAAKILISYRDGGNSNSGTAIVGTVSGTSISFGTAAVFSSGNMFWTESAYDVSAQKVVIVYKNNSNSDYGTALSATISGTSVSFGTPVVFEDSVTDYISVAYDSTAQKIIIAYKDTGNSNYGTSVVWTTSYDVSNYTDFIGITDAAISDTASGSVTIKGGISTNVTGLTPNSTYYVQTNGTLSTTTSSVLAGKALSSTSINLDYTT
jgi:hypothetical protein